MHVPDNYLSPSTCAAFGVAMVPVWRRALRKVKEEISRKKMPLMGICAAFSFLIMMFNIPLPGGTTGHAVGAALAGILLGPYAAVISVTIALVIQALFFGDGGIIAFGVNCFNMAFVMPFVGYYIYSFFKNTFSNKKIQYVGIFLSGYISLNVAALLTAIEFGIQPILFKDAAGLPLYAPYGLSVAIPAMVIPHLLVAGVIEGIVTLGVYSYINKVSPEILYNEENKGKLKPVLALLLTLVILSPLGLIATGTAWGEWGNEEVNGLVGFIPEGMQNGFSFNSLFPDYSISGMGEVSGYILAGVIGVLLILLLFSLTKLSNKHK